MAIINRFLRIQLIVIKGGEYKMVLPVIIVRNKSAVWVVSLNSKKLLEHSPAARVPTAFLFLPNFRVSIT